MFFQKHFKPWHDHVHEPHGVGCQLLTFKFIKDLGPYWKCTAKYIDFIEADALSSIDANFDVTFWFGKKITVFSSLAKLHIKFQKENN